MMKRFIAFVLCLVLALSCCSAFADTNNIITQRSSSVDITVNTYVLTADINNDYILWCTDGTNVGYIEVENGSGDRSLVTTVVLQSGDKEQEVTTTNGAIPASEVAAFAKTVGGDTVDVIIYTKDSTVTKNNIDSTPTEYLSEKAVVTVMNNPNDNDPVDEDDPDGKPTKFTYIVSTITCPSSAFPGDEIYIKGTTDKSALDTKLKGSGYKATVTSTAVWVFNTTATTPEARMDVKNWYSKCLQNSQTDTVETTYIVPDYMISFWVVSKVKVELDTPIVGD